MAALKKASARLDKMMSTFLSQAEEDRQSLERTNNSNMQSFERMDAHFKQIMDILKEEKCQGQLVDNSNEYYMEKECTYYHEQVVTLRSEEVVANQVDERKEEQTKVPKELHQKKEESTETYSTLALIPKIQRVQEIILLELPNEQIEDIKIEKLPKFSSYFIPIHESSPDEKLFEKTQSGPPRSIDNWNPLL
jgi:hypothetical protein